MMNTYSSGQDKSEIADHDEIEPSRIKWQSKIVQTIVPSFIQIPIPNVSSFFPIFHLFPPAADDEMKPTRIKNEN